MIPQVSVISDPASVVELHDRKTRFQGNDLGRTRARSASDGEDEVGVCIRRGLDRFSGCSRRNVLDDSGESTSYAVTELRGQTLDIGGL